MNEHSTSINQRINSICRLQLVRLCYAIAVAQVACGHTDAAGDTQAYAGGLAGPMDDKEWEAGLRLATRFNAWRRSR